MHRQQYVRQRDVDGSWSVRELETNCPAILMGRLMLGLTEEDAVLHLRKFNASNGPEARDPASRVFKSRLTASPNREYPAALPDGTD
jgi:hypothetical protein